MSPMRLVNKPDIGPESLLDFPVSDNTEARLMELELDPATGDVLLEASLADKTLLSTCFVEPNVVPELPEPAGKLLCVRVFVRTQVE